MRRSKDAIPRELRRQPFPAITVLRMLRPLVSVRILIGLGALILVGGLVPNALMLSLGWLVTRVQSPGRDAVALVAPLAVVGSTFLISSIHGPLLGVVGDTLGRRFDTALRDGAMAAASSVAGIAHLEDPRNTDRLTAVEELRWGWLTFRSVMGLAQSWTGRLRGLISAVILGAFAWWAPLMVFVVYRISRAYSNKTGFLYLRRHITTTQDQRRAAYVSGLMHSGVAAKEARVFGISGWFIEQFREAWNQGMREVWRDRNRSMLIGFPAGLLAAGVIGFVTYRIGLAGTTRLSLASVIVSIQAMTGMQGFASTGDPEWQMHFGAYRARDAVRLAEAVRTPVSDLRGAVIPPPLAGGLSFEEVHFAYPGQEREVLEGITFDLPAGSSLAIVGENGAGKTTTIKLLARLYDPTAGRVLVDGVDLRTIDPAAWRRQVGVIFQDFIRYELSARENIGFGAVDLMGDERALRYAAELAGADGFLDRVGWDVLLTRKFEGGVDLSGGEWQRVALARALFAVQAGARLLILDEPTANLDVRAEAAIYERFLEMTRGVTTILISHRFSTVRIADRIVVIEGGRVVETGSHDELLAADGRYATMFRAQASAYEESGEAPVDA